MDPVASPPPHVTLPSDAPSRHFQFASGARPVDGYTIKRGIGQGGFGEVYYALSDAGKEVALKWIRRHLDIERRGVQQCLNLKHPNLVSLYDIRTDAQGDCWVVMEYVDGESLLNALERHPRGMPHDEALAWFRGVAEAVAYLHDHGLVHRDLKPANVLIDGGSIGEGIVKLGDYGLSKYISASQRSGHTERVGTVHYMAPEVALGRYGQEIDIYALGTLFYEMLTGRVPFEGETTAEVLMKHLTATVDLSAVPERFRSAIAACLHKDPQQRPSSVRALLALLEPPPLITPTFDEPQPTQTPAPNPWSDRVVRVWQPLSKTERLVATVTLGVAVWGALQLPSATGLTPVGMNLTLGVMFVCAALLAVGYHVWQRDRHPLATASHGDGPVVATIVEIGPRSLFTQPTYEVPTLTPRDHLRQVCGSLLLSCGIVIASTLVFSWARGAAPQSDQFTWLVLTGTLGAWLLLLVAPLWQHPHSDPTARRFMSMLIGLALGGVSLVLDRLLWIDLPGERPALVALQVDSTAWFDAAGQPQWLAYVGFFGVLFLAVNWSKQLDPRRSRRFSLWSLFTTWLWTMIVAAIAPFPQPWGSLCVLSISLAVQLSSPWYARLRTQWYSS